MLFPPNPPPTCGVMTRTFSGASFNCEAICGWAMKGVWVESQTVSLSPSIRATAVCGSIGACAPYPL